MAVTTTPPSLDLVKWRKSFITEWTRGNLFSPYMGRAENGMRSLIHRAEELKSGGEEIRIPLVVSLANAGVTGANTLAGNEEALDTYGHAVTVDWKRHAVLLNEKEMHKSDADQYAIVRPQLSDWANRQMRDDIIQAMGSINGVNYGSATEAQKDAWQAANADRVLYGAAVANRSGDHSADLAKLDTTNDLMSSGIAGTAKRLARAANPKIRPVRVDGGKEYFVMFHGMRAFRELKNDTAILNANREARPRNVDSNPLFQDGDLMYDGIIHVEVPEIDDLLLQATAGDSSTPVAPSFLCGAQAIAFGIGKMPTPTERKEDDYQFLKGRGIKMCYGINKFVFNGARTGSVNKDWGMVTVWTNTPADA